MNIFVFFIISFSLQKEKSEIEFLLEYRPQKKSNLQREKVNLDLYNTGELKLLSTGIIRLYQLFISTQDMPSCNFTLSCSRFGMKAIQKYGVIHGILMTGDRLQRCHWWSRIYYPVNVKNGLAVDYPVEYYHLEFR